MKSLLQGVGDGVIAWLIYGLVFRMAVDHKPFREAMFSWDSIVFGVAVIILDGVLCYISLAKKAKKGE